MSPIVVVKGRCEQPVLSGPRKGEPCMWRAVTSVTLWRGGGWENDALRVCGVHNRYDRDLWRRLTDEDVPR